MNSSSLYRGLHWLNLPGTLLLLLLQRTPVMRLATAAREAVGGSPIAGILRSAFTATASLGTLHSLAGATEMVTNHDSPLSATVGVAIPTVALSTSGTLTQPDSWTVSGSIPPGINFSGLTSAGTVNVFDAPLTITGTPTAAGNYTVSLRAFELANGGGAASPLYFYEIRVTAAANAAPTITSQPTNQSVAAGGSASFTVAVTGTPAPTVEWRRNGTAVGTGTTLTVNNVQPENTGTYLAVVTNAAGSVTSQSASLGITSTAKLVGPGQEFPDIQHPNGNVFDQILLGGASATITADQNLNQITRMSYIDIDDDIVQIEFSGAGTLSVVLDAPSGPAAPLKYNQSTTNYMKGHAGIVITGANETTNVSVFTVGRLTAFDPTGAFNFLQPVSATNSPANNGSPLFSGHANTTYEGFASIAFLAISSSNGKFGGIRTSNASYFATKGITGVYAPGVEIVGPVFIHDISASDSATPVIMIGSSPDTRITGGNLSQANGRAVQVSGLTQLKFTAGGDSHGNAFAAQSNQGQLEQDGVNVTSQVVVNP